MFIKEKLQIIQNIVGMQNKVHSTESLHWDLNEPNCGVNSEPMARHACNLA